MIKAFSLPVVVALFAAFSVATPRSAIAHDDTGGTVSSMDPAHVVPACDVLAPAKAVAPDTVVAVAESPPCQTYIVNLRRSSSADQDGRRSSVPRGLAVAPSPPMA